MQHGHPSNSIARLPSIDLHDQTHMLPPRVPIAFPGNAVLIGNASPHSCYYYYYYYYYYYAADILLHIYID